MPDFVKVADLSEVPAGEMLLVDFQGDEVALANVDGKIYAIADTCTHMGGRLCQGMLEDNIATCPFHGGKFDVTTGEAVAEPAEEKLDTYLVQVSDNGEIQVANP